MFLNENFPFSLRLFVHVYMFNLLHNMRTNRTIVHVPWERESLHIENFLRYFPAWNTLKLHRGGSSRREWERKKNHEIFHFYHTFARHEVVGCLPPPLLWKIGPKMFRLPTWNFGIRPCNCVFKNVCITIHVLWIIIAICYCYYELWIKESRFIGINSLIKDRY